MSPEDPRHGTTAGFHAGCRDICCRRARAAYEKRCRLDRLNGGRALPAIGAQRRLQALMRLGWSSHRIATEAGLPHRNHVWRILHGQKGKPTAWIQRDTDRWIREVYDRLSMQVPSGRYVARTRAYAERNDYQPPLAWDDESIDDPAARPYRSSERWTPKHDVDPIVVERLLAGQQTKATKGEKDEAMRLWLSWGRSERSLLEMHGWRDGRYGLEEAS